MASNLNIGAEFGTGHSKVFGRKFSRSGISDALLLDKPVPEYTLQDAAPLGIADIRIDSAFTATLATTIRAGLDAGAARAFAHEWAARHNVEISSDLERALGRLPNFDDPVTGALSGAMYGREAIPGPIQRRILTSRPMSRQAQCWPTDALVIAERLLTLGYR